MLHSTQLVKCISSSELSKKTSTDDILQNTKTSNTFQNIKNMFGQKTQRWIPKNECKNW